jgi:ATP-dependent DNA helicase RecG
MGIDSVLDLLTHYPTRYLDQTRQATIAELRVGDAAWVVGEVTACTVVRGPGAGAGRGRGRVELTVTDGTGQLRVTFFNQPFRAGQLPVGTRALFFGVLRTFQGRRVLTNPQVDLLGRQVGRVVPLYPASERAGIASWEIGELVGEALERCGPLADPLPEPWRRRWGLVDRTTAVRTVHRPGAVGDAEPARRRLAFDELLRLQLDVQRRRRVLDEQAAGIRHRVDPVPGHPDLLAAFVAGLPFPLTTAQRRAIGTIRRDMGAPRPMHRLLQGDVGSGKTVVAAATALLAVQGGHQAALLAPTEVLAEQHHRTVSMLVEGLAVPPGDGRSTARPLRVALLTGRVPATARRRITQELADGHVDVVIGTHALLSGDVRFAHLGVVVVDEQHRFGVEQRATLRNRVVAAGGAIPDLLVMTATPIPRTAAMAVLGDLDVTELDELPAGRAPVTTQWCRTEEDDQQAWRTVRDEVAAGRRAFVVCPLVEGSERTAARAAAAEHLRLSEGVLAGIGVGLLHGQRKAADKEAVMAAFRSGDTPVLVATTVVEVGVDVPEATVMVVEDAGRFGIAQLHQLRGRVGRGRWPSWCFLLDRSEAPEVAQRLAAVEASTDGFELAEVDLELRGEGTVMGARQRGRSDLKLASLRRRHRALVAAARQVADAVLDEDPTLAGHPLLADEVALFVGADDQAEEWFGTG